MNTVERVKAYDELIDALRSFHAAWIKANKHLPGSAWLKYDDDYNCMHVTTFDSGLLTRKVPDRLTFLKLCNATSQQVDEFVRASKEDE